MNRLDVVSPEVLSIKRQNPVDTMDIHRRHQLCVVNLTSQNAVLDHYALPFPINRRRVRQDCQESLDFLHLTQSERYRESEAVVRRGPRCHVPELGHILQREIHRIAGGEQFCDTLDR